MELTTTKASLAGALPLLRHPLDVSRTLCIAGRAPL